LELLTNVNAYDFSDSKGNVILTCATAGNRTGGLKKNLETLHGFLKQAKSDFNLTLEQLTSMFKGYLKESRDFEVESVERS